MARLEDTTKQERRNIVKIIDCAIKLIQNVGWCQGANYKSDPITGERLGYCISGALHHVCYEKKISLAVSDDACSMVGEYLKSVGKQRRGSALDCAVRYNDAEKTTKRNILDALRSTKRIVTNFKPSTKSR